MARLGYYRTVQAVVRLGSACVEPLIAVLQNVQDVSKRTNAAQALGEIKDRRAVEPLVAALRDPVIRVRGSAARALGEMRDPGAVEPLIAALSDGSRSDVFLFHPAFGSPGGSDCLDSSRAAIGVLCVLGGLGGLLWFRLERVGKETCKRRLCRQAHRRVCWHSSDGQRCARAAVCGVRPRHADRIRSGDRLMPTT